MTRKLAKGHQGRRRQGEDTSQQVAEEQELSPKSQPTHRRLPHSSWRKGSKMLEGNPIARRPYSLLLVVRRCEGDRHGRSQNERRGRTLSPQSKTKLLKKDSSIMLCAHHTALLIGGWVGPRFVPRETPTCSYLYRTQCPTIIVAERIKLLIVLQPTLFSLIRLCL